MRCISAKKHFVEEQMSFTLIPSLKHIALAKVAITLWHRSNVQDFMTIFHCKTLDPIQSCEDYEIVKSKVLEKAQYLSPIPETLKLELFQFIPFIGDQIVDWYEDYAYDYIGIRLPAELCWTPQGTVDRKKTAEILVKDESLDIARRYRLACIYCLEDDIKELWTMMPVSMKEEVLLNDERGVYTEENNLVVFWTYYIKGDEDNLKDFIRNIRDLLAPRYPLSPYQFAFEYATRHDMIVAAKYFSQKLIARDKNSVVSCAEFAAEVLFAHDVLYFLLLQMNREQQVNIFKKYHSEILNCFKKLPKLTFFTETAHRLLNSLSNEDYYDLLHSAAFFTGYVYCSTTFFEDLWQLSPHTHKKYIVSRCVSDKTFLLYLLQEDKTNVRCILKYASVEEKEKIIFSDNGTHICESLMYSTQWDLLKFFIQECVPSVDIMIKFKEESKKNIFSGSEKAPEKEVYDRFFQLLDDLIKNDEKIKKDEGDTCPSE